MNTPSRRAFAIIINPYFKIDYYDKITYFECSQDFLADKNLVKKYCESLFRKI